LCAGFRVAGEGARLGQPEILLGIIPGAGGTQRLPRLVGPARAKDIIYTGRFVPAAEAREIGPVDRAVPDGEVYPAATWPHATRPAPRWRCRPPSRRSTTAWMSAWPPAWRSRRLHFSGLFATEDRRAGMRSFIENGPGKATFTGR
jgi:enoyl-CoA hydratase/carnithine racemase